MGCQPSVMMMPRLDEPGDFQDYQKLLEPQIAKKYRPIEHVMAKGSTVIFVARWHQKRVILKTISAKYPSAQMRQKFRNEIEMATSLRKVKGVVKVLNVIKQNDRDILVMEYAGMTLETLIKDDCLPLDQFYLMAGSMSKILARIHDKHIIHKDINPTNVFVEAKPDQPPTIRISDFGISTMIKKESNHPRPLASLEGTLAYVSPEQTGRMNRFLDYRTDLYSLGATYYKMLTGSVVFPSDNTLDLIRSHMSKKPTPPHVLNPEVPPKLSEIVLKLLEKEADNRYQTARGVHYDLKLCRQGRLNELGTADISSEFVIPDKLYGRQLEINLILSSFQCMIRDGRQQMIFINGLSGVGKSRVVSEVYKPITEHKGYFVRGKHDLYKRNMILYGFVEGFSNLIDQILAEDQRSIRRWRHVIQKALGKNGQVIVDVIHDLELIIGKQPPLQELSSVEAKKRYNETFLEFVKVFADKEHPLTIFLDDLQWADLSSLNLIQMLRSSENVEYLYIIGSYRDNEVSDAHPLSMMKDELKREHGIIIPTIHLNSLTLDDTNQMVADTLKCKPKETFELTKLIMNKTAGTPFFVTQFLTSLHENDLVLFNRVKGKWEWELEKIQGTKMTANVIDLMCDKIQVLSIDAQMVLKYGSALGHTFDMDLLVQLLPPTVDVVVGLQDALKGLFIEQIGSTKYSFYHDRIHQACASLMDKATTELIHITIARHMIDNTTDEEKKEQVIQIVNHVNLALELAEQHGINVIEVNYEAAQKAYGSCAWSSAESYLNTALQIIESKMNNTNLPPFYQNEPAWDESQELFKVMLLLAEVTFLCNDYKKANALFNDLYQQDITKEQSVQVDMRHIILLRSIGQHVAVCKKGQIALNKLGEVYEGEGSPGDMKKRIEDLRAEYNKLMGDRRIGELVYMKNGNNPVAAIKSEIMSLIAPSAYFNNVLLAGYNALKMVILMLKEGKNPFSAFGLGLGGMVFSIIFNDVQKSFEFGRAALKLADQVDTPLCYSMTHVIVAMFTMHYRVHLKECLPLHRSSVKNGLACSDLMHVSWAWSNICRSSLLLGTSLSEILQECTKCLPWLQKNRQEVSYFVIPIQGFCRLLMGKQIDKKKNPLFSLDMKKKIMECPIQGVRVVYHMCRMWIYMLENHIAEAMKEMKFGEEAQKYGIGQHETLMVDFISVCVLFKYLSDFYDEEIMTRAEVAKKIKSIRLKYSRWQRTCPSNFDHIVGGIDAVLDCMNNKPKLAQKKFDKAISDAAENGYLPVQVMLNEIASIFFKGRDVEKAAKYENEFQQLGTQWGYKKTEYRFLSRRGTTSANQTSTVTDEKDGINSFSSALDVETIMKASNAINDATDLGLLLENMLTIVTENSGAVRGVILLPKKEEWFIQGEKNGVTIDVMQHVDMTKYKEIPQTIVQYALRTGKILNISDATVDERFNKDPFIQRTRMRSILLIPLLHKDEMVGMIYLENGNFPGAFSPERTTLISMITTQAALSIRSATLYASMSQFIPEEYQSKMADVETNLGTHIQDTIAVLFKKPKMETKSVTIMYVRIDNGPEVQPLFFDYYELFFQTVGLEAQKSGKLVEFSQKKIIFSFETAKAALSAAIRIRDQNEKTPIPYSIGIATGKQWTGTMGNQFMKKEWSFGVVTDRAKKLAKSSKEWDCKVFLDDKSTQDAKKFVVRRIVHEEAWLLVESSNLKDDEWFYEIRDQEAADRFSVWNQAVDLMQSGFEKEAKSMFEKFLEKHPDDSIAKRHIHIAQGFCERDQF